ncbi:MAG: glutamine synthetase family protein [Gaiellales bacterium]
MSVIENRDLQGVREDVLRRVADDDIKFIRLWFTDVLGRLKSFAITRDEMENALTRGMGFDGSSVTGFNAIEESDMIAMPDPTTFRVMPWRAGERSVARMICDVRTPDGEPYAADSRHVLRQALERMQGLGFDSFKVGPELEYFYFKLDDDGRPRPLDAGGYFEETPLDASVDLRKHTVLALEEMGIPVEYLHHEVGPSQHEIDVRYADGLEMADHCITYRAVVKEVAQKHGVYATFMPKPLFGVNGSGMHTHQSLFVGESNAFFDAEDSWYLSDVAKSFIAGQLRHAREISLLFAQWVNSYKRLVPGFEAPVYIAWSRRNRSALIRVPLYHPGHERATRAEIRCPDPACNPYLAFAGLLHAGLEGIERGYELPDPMETNLYELSKPERRALGIESLPESLGEAIDVAAESELVERALGPELRDRLIALKRAEWDEYRVQVTPWELERYLPTL